MFSMYKVVVQVVLKPTWTHQPSADSAAAIWLPTAALFFTSWMFAASDFPPVLLRIDASRKGVTCDRA